jgi:Cu(I)/Ag(I) efflux system protein CusF
MRKGQVQKMDGSAGKAALKHWPTESLGMDQGMTMVLAVRAPSPLKSPKTGDDVSFHAERVNGLMTITRSRKRIGVSNFGTPAIGDRVRRNASGSRS